MHPEIEKLIDLALADGQVTEKEKAIILRKAEALGEDQDEVEMTIDGMLHRYEANITTLKEKAGNVKTCPSCGAPVKAFQIKCESCDHEFTETKASRSITAFYDELKTKSFKEQALIITAYPIASNKEAVLEFLALSIGNCKRLELSERSAYLESAWSGKYSKELGLRESVIYAWKSKTIQAINQGKTLFKNDTLLLTEILRYEKQYIEISKDPILVHQEKAFKGLLLYFILCACLLVDACIFVL